MAKMTLIDMVQNILSAMDSDYASSIGDSVEADQVALVVQETYFDLLNVLELPEHKEIIALTALSDTDHPNYLQFPSSVRNIETFQYDKQTIADTNLRYKTITFLEPIAFQNRFRERSEDASNVEAISDFNAGILLVINDVHPHFWTSFDDNYIVCDSFDAAVDSTLQASKTFCYGLTEPTWTHNDTFIPDLDANLFPLLLEEAKATSFVNFKQVSNTRAEAKARRQITSVQGNLHRRSVNHLEKQPDYGRGSGSGSTVFDA